VRLASLRATAIVAATLVGWAAVGAHAEDSDDGSKRRKLEDTPRLTVSGHAELERPADRVTIAVGVTTEAKMAGAALKENTAKMNAVIEALEESGVQAGELETGRFRIRPVYSSRPTRAATEEDWRPQITGYEAVNTLHLKTTQLEKAGEFVEAANAAGANSVSVVSFDLADERRYREEVVRSATRHALDDANILSDAAGLVLVRITNIHLDQSAPRMNEPLVAAQSRGRAEMAVSAPPIVAGDVIIEATVTIVYEIAPRAAGAEKP